MRRAFSHRHGCRWKPPGGPSRPGPARPDRGRPRRRTSRAGPSMARRSLARCFPRPPSLKWPTRPCRGRTGPRGGASRRPAMPGERRAGSPERHGPCVPPGRTPRPRRIRRSTAAPPSLDPPVGANRRPGPRSAVRARHEPRRQRNIRKAQAERNTPSNVDEPSDFAPVRLRSAPARSTAPTRGGRSIALNRAVVASAHGTRTRGTPPWTASSLPHQTAREPPTQPAWSAYFAARFCSSSHW